MVQWQEEVGMFAPKKKSPSIYHIVVTDNTVSLT